MITAAADERNKLAHLAWIQERAPGMRVVREHGIVIADSGGASDTFNIVCAARLSANRLPAAAVFAQRHFGPRPFTWWVGPADEPANLGELLESEHFRATGAEPGMWLDLARQPAAPRPAELVIRPVRTPADLDDYVSALSSLAPGDASIAAFFTAAAATVLREDCPLLLLTGFAGSQCVATGELAVTGDVGGLYNIATREAFRRRGIGAAMTVALLDEARRRGCTRAVLQASSDGLPIYRKLGFETFGWFTEYHVTAASLIDAPAHPGAVR